MDIAQELIGRARELQPVIAKRAAATEQKRSLLDETVKDLCDAGFMQILTPKRYGGHELNVETMVEIGRILGTACMSTGWVASFYIGHNWLYAVFPEKAQEEVFANGPYDLSSGQIAPTARATRVKGGYEVSGRQGWSSGVVHSNHMFFTGMLTEEGKPPHPTMFLIPRDQVKIIDNWFIAGMKGTGSLDVEVDKVFVPEHRAVSFISLIEGTHPGGKIHENPLYGLPAVTVLSFEALGPLAGGLRGMAENFVQMTKDRVTSYTGSSVAAKPGAQMRAGRGMGMADAVDTLLRDAVRRVDGHKSKDPLSLDMRAELRMRSGIINKLVCDSVNDIMHGAGGNSFREDSPLQRFFRDVNVLRTHAALDIEPLSETYGRILLGMDPGGPV